VGVVLWLLSGVDPGGWDEFWESVLVEADVSAAVVDAAVMMPTEQDEVAQGGVAAVGPVCDVVGVAPCWGAGAAGEGAATVAHDECGVLCGGDGAVFAADVEGNTVGVGEDAGDAGVAGEASYSLGR
jgi:hypothetical protein